MSTKESPLKLCDLNRRIQKPSFQLFIDFGEFSVITVIYLLLGIVKDNSIYFLSISGPLVKLISFTVFMILINDPVTDNQKIMYARILLLVRVLCDVLLILIYRILTPYIELPKLAFVLLCIITCIQITLSAISVCILTKLLESNEEESSQLNHTNEKKKQIRIS